MRKRKLISILFAVALIFSMAVVCSAASVSYTDTYNDCTYAISANCYTDRFNSLIEYQYSDTGDESDYLLQVFVQYYYKVVTDGFDYTAYSTDYSIAATGISGIGRSVANLESLITLFYINTECVASEVVSAN